MNDDEIAALDARAILGPLADLPSWVRRTPRCAPS